MTMKLLLIVAALFSNPGIPYFGAEPRYVGNTAYFPLAGTVASTALGPTAPSFAQCGNAFGQEFVAPGENSYHAGPLLPCWNGSSDILVRIFFANELGDVIADGETIIFNLDYRSAGPTAGTALAGNEVTAVATYTQSGAGADCEINFVDFTLDRNDSDQPYTYGDSLLGTFSAPGGGTYSGDPVIGNVIFLIQYSQICHAA
jgi:hypothetical protein